MHLVGRFDSMNDYQEFRAAYMADPEMTEQIKKVLNWLTSPKIELEKL